MEIVNGETAKRKDLQNDLDKQQKDIDEKYGGNTNKSKEEFKTGKEYREYKKIMKNFSKTSADLKQGIENEQKVQASIDDFAMSDPENFNKANNLTFIDSSGNERVLDVTVVAGEASSDGGAVTGISFYNDGDISSIQTTIDYDDVEPESNVLAHEMGHAYNSAKNPKQARANSGKINCQAAENRNSFRAKTAMDWQQHYDAVKPINYLKYLLMTVN